MNALVVSLGALIARLSRGKQRFRGDPRCEARWMIEPESQCTKLLGHEGNHHAEGPEGTTYSWYTARG